MKRYFVFPFVLTLLTAAALFVSGCSADKKTDPAKARRDRMVPVSVSPVLQKTIPVDLSAISNVEAFSSVAIKSRIGGELKKVHFQEGQEVRQGDLLFTIDSLPYEAALKQAQANLARTVALAKKADEDLRRYQDLVQKEYISQEQFDQSRANAEALQASLKADQAAVDNARLNLKYCYLYAPMTGIAGSLQAYRGAQIKSNDDKPMVTINQIQPIYVTFAVPEQNLNQIKKYAVLGTLRVRASTNNGEAYQEEGQLAFIDNTVDPATGTIRLKGRFANKDKKLWPGQYSRVTLTLTSEPNILVIPSQAIQTGLEGQYVFIARPDQTVESRPIGVGRTYDDYTVIVKGLRAGEQVVTDGQFQLVPGAKIQIKKTIDPKGTSRP
jgi:membrane fusion protein, multidrug efflux system